MSVDSTTYRLGAMIKSPWDFFESAGRFVVDFGFGSLLEKFEEYFGRSAAKCLVALVGFAVIAVCLGLIWEFAYPIIDWLTGTSAGIGAYGLIMRTGGFVLALLFLAGTASTIVDALMLRRTMEEAGEYLRIAIQEMERSAEVSEQMAEILDLAGEASDNKLSELETDNFRKLAVGTRSMVDRLRKLRSDYYGED